MLILINFFSAFFYVISRLHQTSFTDLPVIFRAVFTRLKLAFVSSALHNSAKYMSGFGGVRKKEAAGDAVRPNVIIRMCDLQEDDDLGGDVSMCDVSGSSSSPREAPEVVLALTRQITFMLETF
jgi:hypothetical protein